MDGWQQLALRHAVRALCRTRYTGSMRWGTLVSYGSLRYGTEGSQRQRPRRRVHRRLALRTMNFSTDPRLRSSSRTTHILCTGSSPITCGQCELLHTLHVACCTRCVLHTCRSTAHHGSRAAGTAVRRGAERSGGLTRSRNWRSKNGVRACATRHHSTAYSVWCGTAATRRRQ